MYEKGDLIIYGNVGVCRIDDICCPDISSLNQERIYYILNPLYQEGVIYTPIDTATFMRPVISLDEAKRLIRQIPDIRVNICTERNLRALNDHYREFLQTNACIDLLQMIKDIYAKFKMVAAQGKKLGQTDEKYMKQAENLLHGELAVALNIPKSDVAEYIKQNVEASAQ